MRNAIGLLAVIWLPLLKALFLILIALVIPGFFVLTWLMSRKHKDKKKSPADKEGV
jgi:Flp pilus assembly protein protease CpaA